jgi:hypothetical protein
MIRINAKFPVRPDRVDEWISLGWAYAHAKASDLVAARREVIDIDAPDALGPMDEIQPR